MSEFYLVTYLVLSIFFVVLEHRSFEYDFSGLTFKEKVCSILQQIIHYTRFAITWPLYLLEDFILWVENSEESSGEE